MMNIPELFICPISLELFKDPVTLCTGLTYDRSSIQKWLAAGNLTCPVTMQKLDDPITMVPNHTLRHLITQWLQMGTQTENSNHSDDHCVLETATIDSLASVKHVLKSNEFGFKSKVLALEKITSSPSTDYLLLQLGYLPLLLELVFGLVPEARVLLISEEHYCIKFVELALSCVLMLLPLGVELESLNMLKEERKLSSFEVLLACGSAFIRINLCRLIEAVSASDSSSSSSISRRKRLCIVLGKHRGILNQLVQLILHPNDSEEEAADAAIRALSSLSSFEENIESLVRNGMVNGLVTYITRTVKHERSLAPLATAIIERLLGVESAREELLNSNSNNGTSGNGIHALVKMVFRVSWSDVDDDHEHHRGSESAVSSLLIVCNDSVLAREEAISVGVLTQLLLLMQSQCSSSTKAKARKLLKLLRTKWSQDSKQFISMV
ncbi:PREDICTED: U-box domain-containing protein 25-like [Fragaria vesca subsp. vesca]|uniref:U-box domain-containing protein 25-like n=1 Tax=Fragaria vesca subsp. vesca TaxID=101020 RepID=UPI0002C2E843|nr:PREDICTED: U-box domain-containing protein 25-like [Fragaria vesca subsp. vesca]